MAVYRLKRSLTSGEISPLLYGRTTLDVFKNGCKSAVNAIIKPQGPIGNRPGTEFIADMSFLFSEEITSYKLVDFVFDETQSYCLIFLTGPTKTEIYIAAYDAVSGTYGLVADPSVPTTPYKVVNITASGFNLSSDSFDYAQSKDVLFIACGEEVPLQLSRIAHDDWALSAIVFSGTPVKWGASDGYPKKISFFEQRLVLASTRAYPQFLWFSEAGDYYNMTPGVSGSDPIEAQIKSEKHNQIQWMSSGSELLIGTIGEEWTISGSSEYFSIDTIRIKRHSAKGGEALKPINIGNSTLFVERLGRAVNEFAYDYRSAGYSSVNLSVLSTHLTDEYNIVRWAYQAVPNSCIWCVRSDGWLLSLTFQREHEIIGWAPHNTEGNFKDVCCTPEENNRETNCWMLVERNVEGNSRMYLERLTSEFMVQGAETAWFVDSGLSYNESGIPTTIISGLNHLEGKTVSVLTNGAVHPSRQVVGGQIELLYESDRVTVGLPYVTQIIPLLPEHSLQDGSSIGRRQRIVNVSIHLYRSLGLWLGRKVDEMEEIPFRLPTDLTGVGVPLYTGVKKIAFPEGYDEEAIIILEQRQPLPMWIISIMDESEVYE